MNWPQGGGVAVALAAAACSAVGAPAFWCSCQMLRTTHLAEVVTGICCLLLHKAGDVYRAGFKLTAALESGSVGNCNDCISCTVGPVVPDQTQHGTVGSSSH